MKKINTYILSAFAAIVMLPFAVSAQTGEVKQSKTVADNGDGTYTVTLESYVTGEVVKQPLDIVLVLDNSNSMTAYNIGSTSTKRMVALKNSVRQFLDQIYNGGDTPAHRIALVKFENGGRRIDRYVNYDENHLRASNLMGDGTWINMTSSDITSAKNRIGTTNTDGQLHGGDTTGTPAAEGLKYAEKLLKSDGIIDDGRQKVVVFFTDGCCGTGEHWGDDDAGHNNSNPYGYIDGTLIPNRYYAPTVVDAANSLKEIATVYCIGTFGAFTDTDNHTGDELKGDTYFYLRHVSSEYNNSIRVDGYVPTTPKNNVKWVSPTHDAYLPKTTGTDSRTGEAIDPDYAFDQPFHSVSTGDRDLSLENDEYVFDASDAASLAAAFNKIATDIVEAADLGPGSAVAIDAMTNQFELPENVTADDIKLYTSNATVTGTAPNLNISWGPRTAWKPWTTVAGKTITDYISINPASSKAGIEFDSDYLEVTGYDYKSHFVGLNNTTGGSQKLIIEFLIKAAPSNRGGLNVHTNDIHSGIYNKKDGSDKYELVIAYDKPTVNLPYLKIVKKGLNAGESALFSVTKVTETGATVTGDGAYSATVMVSQADDTGVASATIKLVYNGYYKVEELTWSNLGYTVVKHDTDGNGNCTVTGNSYTRQMNTIGTGVARELVYTFENTAGGARPDHAEDYVPNDLGITESASMTGGGTGETPASGAPEENPGGPIGF